MSLSAADLATLSLLDRDQGVCPNGHPCRLDAVVGYRRRATCKERGLALICWDITLGTIEAAARAGAATNIVGWAEEFIADRSRPSSA